MSVSFTTYNPGEWFPLIMNLQGGDYIGPDKHKGSLTVYIQFDKAQDGYNRRITGAGEYPLYRFFGQYIRGHRLTYNISQDGEIRASGIMKTE